MAKKENKLSFTVVGGIGDIILYIPNILNIAAMFDPSSLLCVIITHAKYAEEFILQQLSSAGISGMETKQFLFSSNDELLKLHHTVIASLENDPNYIGNASDFEASTKPNIYPELSLSQKNEDRAVEILSKLNEFKPSCVDIAFHPFGSPFANEFIEGKRHLHGKNFPVELMPTLFTEIKNLYKGKKVNIFILGSKQELTETRDKLIGLYGTSFDRNITIQFVYENIEVALYLARLCDIVIAADSAVKSYTCAVKKTTIVFFGDYEDPVRDAKFLNPYIKDGVLIPIRYTQITDETVAEIIGEISELSNFSSLN